MTRGACCVPRPPGGAPSTGHRGEGGGPATELELLSTLQTHRERRKEGEEEGHTENITLIGQIY